MSDPRELAAWRAYYLPGTEVLRNKLGATDAGALRDAERRIAALAAPDLVKKPPPLTPDGHREVHRRMFGEVYAWAGEYRRASLNKERTRFAEPGAIAAALTESYGRLRTERFLTGLDRERFVDRAALYLAQWNLVHPFRDGNGRVQRVMVQALGREAGHPLDFRSISAERMDRASVEAANPRNAKLDGLRAILREAADPERLAVFDKMRPVLEALRRDGHLDWNKADIAVARPGERLDGIAALPREADRIYVLKVAGGRLVIASLAPGQTMPEAGKRVSHLEPEQARRDAWEQPLTARSDHDLPPTLRIAAGRGRTSNGRAGERGIDR